VPAAAMMVTSVSYIADVAQVRVDGSLRRRQPDVPRCWSGSPDRTCRPPGDVQGRYHGGWDSRGCGHFGITTEKKTSFIAAPSAACSARTLRLPPSTSTHTQYGSPPRIWSTSPA
jgi:hypothetical protein